MSVTSDLRAHERSQSGMRSAAWRFAGDGGAELGLGRTAEAVMWRTVERAPIAPSS